MLTAERLREVLDYDPATGVFVRNGKSDFARNGQGYQVISVDGRCYLAHRLAWLYVHGGWPPMLDHVNCERADNRIVNLRQATASQNNANKRAQSNNASGLKGIYFRRDCNKWHAQIWCNGKRKHLGYFATARQAHAAYQGAAESLFGEFARAA